MACMPLSFLNSMPTAATSESSAEAYTPGRLRTGCELTATTTFGLWIKGPKILVCGLNPHAGEGGHLGREEIEIIEPVIAEKRLEGINVVGPLPADTLFTEKYLADADAVLSMFHDQGLPVLKYKGFGNSSNITLGLPIIRTSVDHGTALDLAGSGKVNTGSMYNAIATALEMSKHWSP